jgi:hypothetical protein
MRGKRVHPIVLALFGLLFSGMAGFFMWVSIIDITRQARLITHGTATQAEILHGTINERRTGKKGTGRRYTVAVTYRFAVDGRQLQSERVFAHDISFAERAEAEAVLATYPVGSSSTAYYDPLSPQESCLDRRLTFTPYWGVLFPSLHLSIGLLMILWAFRSDAHPRGHLRRLAALLLLVTVILVSGPVHFLIIGGSVDLLTALGIGLFASALLGCGWWWSRAYAGAQRLEGTGA